MRILDFTRLLPGPLCTMLLGGMGADVVKIEDTGLGHWSVSSLVGITGPPELVEGPPPGHDMNHAA